jgi:hypothetical protein
MLILPDLSGSSKGRDMTLGALAVTGLVLIPAAVAAFRAATK